MRIVRFFSLLACIVILCSLSAFAAAPVILAQPQNVYLPQNQQFPITVYFSVLAQGDDLSYQWQVSRSLGAAWTNIDNASSNTPTLQIQQTSTTINNGRVYRCVITGVDGAVTTKAVTVTVGAVTMNSLPQLLGWVSETCYSIFDWVGSCCNQIVQEPLLLFTVGFLALGGSIAILSRLLSRS